MNCLVGKHISEDVYNLLESEQRQDQIENILAAAFSLNGLDHTKRHIVLNCYTRHYGFCKKYAFDYKKTSAFLSIMHVLLERDTRLHTDEIDMFRSCDYFEELLQTHSVERSPVSTVVFDEQDIPRIYDYVISQYYQHFKLLRYSLGVHSRVFLVQSNRNDIEDPNTSNLLPLPVSTHQS